MKKLFAILIFVALLVTGCGTKAYEAEVTIDFPERKPGEIFFPTSLLDYTTGKRTGKYTGEINEQGIPHGHGKFVFKTIEGAYFTVEGEFKNGQYVRDE